MVTNRIGRRDGNIMLRGRQPKRCQLSRREVQGPVSGIRIDGCRKRTAGHARDRHTDGLSCARYAGGSGERLAVNIRRFCNVQRAVTEWQINRRLRNVIDAHINRCRQRRGVARTVGHGHHDRPCAILQAQQLCWRQGNRPGSGSRIHHHRHRVTVNDHSDGLTRRGDTGGTGNAAARGRFIQIQYAVTEWHVNASHWQNLRHRREIKGTGRTGIPRAVGGGHADGVRVIRQPLKHAGRHGRRPGAVIGDGGQHRRAIDSHQNGLPRTGNAG